jgi:hypothetical protein
MIDKSKYICTTPFFFTEVEDNKQFLCCPSWLSTDINSGKGILDSFNSEISEKIRDSVTDGSYKYCNEFLCPYLASFKSNRIPSKFIPNTSENVDYLHKTKGPKIINFTFDRSCNFQCPSCRVELINYKGSKRISVEKKLTEINDEISPFVERLVLSGSADPFFSKSFRQFLITLDSNRFKKLKSIHLHTNGSLWTPEMWEKMNGIHRYVNTCEISIDAATKETYETKTRIGGNWDVLHENLKFITKIPTIKEYIFSFVVQDTNYREMHDFYKMIKSYMDKRETKVKWDIRTNVISDWGTFSEAEFKIKNVANPDHAEYNSFLLELDKVKNIPNVIHNFHHLYTTEKPLI